jgi:molybdopterin synthase sulfur carrier subunit
MQVNFYATLRPIVGGRTVIFDLSEGVTVRELVDAAVTRFPPLRTQLLDANGNLYSHVHVFVNGRDAPYLPKGVETIIAPGDTIDIFPAVAGG